MNKDKDKERREIAKQRIAEKKRLLNKNKKVVEEEVVEEEPEEIKIDGMSPWNYDYAQPHPDDNPTI